MWRLGPAVHGTQSFARALEEACLEEDDEAGLPPGLETRLAARMRGDIVGNYAMTLVGLMGSRCQPATPPNNNTTLPVSARHLGRAWGLAAEVYAAPAAPAPPPLPSGPSRREPRGLGSLLFQHGPHP
jgi:hypothetical protein